MFLRFLNTPKVALKLTREKQGRPNYILKCNSHNRIYCEISPPMDIDIPEQKPGRDVIKKRSEIVSVISR